MKNVMHFLTLAVMLITLAGTQHVQAQHQYTASNDVKQLARVFTGARITYVSSFGGIGIGAGEKTVSQIHLCPGGQYHSFSYTRRASGADSSWEDAGTWRIARTRNGTVMTTRSASTGQFDSLPVQYLLMAAKSGVLTRGNQKIEFVSRGAQCR